MAATRAFATTGHACVDLRRHIIIRVPQFDSGLAERGAGAPGCRFDWIGMYRRDEPGVRNGLAFA